GGGDFTSNLMGDMWGTPTADYGPQTAALGPDFAPTTTDLYGGSSSNLYAAATGETNMLPAPRSQDYEPVEKETQGAPEAEVLPTVTVSRDEATPVTGGRGEEETPATPAGGEPPVEGGATQEPAISGNVAPEVTANRQEQEQRQAAGEPAP